MMWVLFGGVVAMIGMQAVTLFNTHRAKKQLEDLLNGTVNAVGHFNERLQGIEKIPEILQDLNLGGVQLMPQKTLGETILDGAIKYFWGNSDQSKTIESEQLVEVDATKTESDLHP